MYICVYVCVSLSLLAILHTSTKQPPSSIPPSPFSSCHPLLSQFLLPYPPTLTPTFSSFLPPSHLLRVGISQMIHPYILCIYCATLQEVGKMNESTNHNPTSAFVIPYLFRVRISQIIPALENYRSRFIARQWPLGRRDRE